MDDDGLRRLPADEAERPAETELGDSPEFVITCEFVRM